MTVSIAGIHNIKASRLPDTLSLRPSHIRRVLPCLKSCGNADARASCSMLRAPASCSCTARLGALSSARPQARRTSARAGNTAFCCSCPRGAFSSPCTKYSQCQRQRVIVLTQRCEAAAALACCACCACCGWCTRGAALLPSQPAHVHACLQAASVLVRPSQELCMAWHAQSSNKDWLLATYQCGNNMSMLDLKSFLGPILTLDSGCTTDKAHGAPGCSADIEQSTAMVGQRPLKKISSHLESAAWAGQGAGRSPLVPACSGTLGPLG